MPSTFCWGTVILAAGFSRRMGKTKALLTAEEGGPSLLEWWVTACRRGGTDAVVVVGGDDSRVEAEARRLGAAVTTNPDVANTGAGHSLLLGAASLRGPRPDLDGILFSPVDVPPPTLSTLGSLVGTLAIHPHAVASLPIHRGQRGHPVLVRWSFLDLLAAQGEPRADRALAEAAVIEINTENPDVLRNLNTPEAWEDWCRRGRAQGEETGGVGGGVKVRT